MALRMAITSLHQNPDQRLVSIRAEAAAKLQRLADELEQERAIVVKKDPKTPTITGAKNEPQPFTQRT
jgi:hypothetical protein